MARGTGDTSWGGRRRDFPSTRSSLLKGAGDPADPRHRELLESFVKIYWKPVYLFIRGVWARPNEEAKDLTQSFFAELLGGEVLSRLPPDLGSFRKYLKRSISNHLIDEARRRKPAGTAASPLPFSVLGSRPDPAAPDTASVSMEKSLFEDLFGRKLEELRRRLEAHDRAREFDVFDAYCIRPFFVPGEGVPTYAQVAARFGVKPTDVTNILARVRRDLRALLQEKPDL